MQRMKWPISMKANRLQVTFQQQIANIYEPCIIKHQFVYNIENGKQRGRKRHKKWWKTGENGGKVQPSSGSVHTFGRHLLRNKCSPWFPAAHHRSPMQQFIKTFIAIRGPFHFGPKIQHRRNGEHYKSIHFKLYEKCRVNLSISKENEDDAGNRAALFFHVVIRGQPGKCETARDALMDMIRVIDSVSIPKKHHSLVIGRKGETIKKISEENDVFITVPPWGQRFNEDVTVIGADEQVVDRVCQQLKSLVGKARVQFSQQEILVST